MAREPQDQSDAKQTQYADAGTLSHLISEDRARGQSTATYEDMFRGYLKMDDVLRLEVATSAQLAIIEDCCLPEHKQKFRLHTDQFQGLLF